MKEISLSRQALSLKPGIYRHYKGKKYRAIGVGLHSETLEEMVIYKALYGKKILWTRPLKMFLETMTVNGKLLPRFCYITPPSG